MAQLALEPYVRDGAPASSLRLGRAEVRRAAVALEGAEPAEVVRWALDRFERDRVAVVTGLQADGVAIATMALDVDPEVRILTIDTGRLHAETHTYLDTLRARWHRDIEVVRPEPARVVAMVSAHGADLMYASPELRQRCCAVRKVEPLDGVMVDIDCWFTGLRRDQSATRASIDVVAEDPQRPGVVKVSPLASWTEEQAIAFLRSRDVPVHPLYGRGYRSIGCAPCTRAVRPGEPARAGRWWWEQGIASECGIHVATPDRGSR